MAQLTAHKGSYRKKMAGFPHIIKGSYRFRQGRFKLKVAVLRRGMLVKSFYYWVECCGWTMVGAESSSGRYSAPVWPTLESVKKALRLCSAPTLLLVADEVDIYVSHICIYLTLDKNLQNRNKE